MIQEIEFRQVAELLEELSDKKTAKINEFTFQRVSLKDDDQMDVDAGRFHGYEFEYPIIEVYYQGECVTRVNTIAQERWKIMWRLYERLLGVVDTLNTPKFRIDSKQVN